MTVTADKLPPLPTIMGALDTGARVAANEARRRGVPIVRAALPARSGRAQRGTVGRVARTATGYRLEVAPTSRVKYPNGVTARQVVRWLHSGTGIFGARRRVIRPRKAPAFRLSNGWFSETVKGQRGRDYYGQGAASANGPVVHAFEDGARHAARLVERVI